METLAATAESRRMGSLTIRRSRLATGNVASSEVISTRIAIFSSAEVKTQPTAAAPESASASTRESQPPAQEDLGCVVIDGKTSKIICVRSADPVSVFVIYESDAGGKGGRKIPRQELPPQLQAKYPYDAARAAEYRKQQADQAAEQAALSVQQAAGARAAARDVLRQKEREFLA